MARSQTLPAGLGDGFRGSVSQGRVGAISFYENKQYWVNASWITPGWEWVDPLKEAQAAEVGIRNGIITYSDLYSAQGKDWEGML